MNVEELNPSNSLINWDPIIFAEFQKGNFTKDVGERLLFENEIVRVWTIRLLPNKSLPFHRHITNYSWTAMTAGIAISHYETGRIVKLTYEKGDLSYYDHDTKGDFVHNLKNIGDNILEFVTVEYVRS